MRLIEEAGLVENAAAMGDYLYEKLVDLKAKHSMIGDVRGKGLLAGVELVTDLETKKPVPESVAVAVAADCMSNGVIIGRTNRSFKEFNNTLALCPALTVNKEQIDQIIDALGNAIERVS
jgi:taurine-pyruvate aminotransferase